MSPAARADVARSHGVLAVRCARRPEPRRLRRPGRVQYDSGRCSKAERSLYGRGRSRPTRRRSRAGSPHADLVRRRSRSSVVLLARGNAEKALLLDSRASRGRARHLQRLREVLARHRESRSASRRDRRRLARPHRRRWQRVLYLDIDKRAKRAVARDAGFCHLAMRAQEEEGALDEQRHTFRPSSRRRDIRALVGKPSPDEQRRGAVDRRPA